MQRNQKIITTVLWSVLVLTMIAVVGRGMWAAGDDPAARDIQISSDAPVEDGLPILFNAPQFSLVDQDAKPFNSDALDGHVWVAALIFTNCPGACPMMTKKMAALQAAVPSKNVRLVSFTVDPERDTPAVLKQYAATLAQADESRWHFLTGDKDAMFRAAEGLNLSASPADGDNAIQHAEKFLLVDSQGRVRGIYESKDDEDLKRLAKDAETLAGV